MDFKGKRFALTGTAGYEKRKLEKKIVDEGGILTRGFADYHIFGAGDIPEVEGFAMTPDVFWYLTGEKYDIKKVASFYIKYRKDSDFPVDDLWDEILSCGSEYIDMIISTDNVSVLKKFMELKEKEISKYTAEGLASPYAMIHRTDSYIKIAAEKGSAETASWLLEYKGRNFTKEELRQAADDLFDKETGFRDLYLEERFERITDINLLSCEEDGIVQFGLYPQSSNGCIERIRWKILEKRDNMMLLLAEKALDCMPFNGSREYTGWEGSDIRSRLNNEFFMSAFSLDEQIAIAETEISNDRNPEHWTKSGSGKPTSDRVFLLSTQEVLKYMPEKKDRICIAAEYAVKKGAWTDKSGGCWWWHRTAGYYGFDAVITHHDGSVYNIGYNATAGKTCVRPALWIDIDSLKTGAGL